MYLGTKIKTIFWAIHQKYESEDLQTSRWHNYAYKLLKADILRFQYLQCCFRHIIGRLGPALPHDHGRSPLVFGAVLE